MPPLRPTINNSRMIAPASGFAQRIIKASPPSFAKSAKEGWGTAFVEWSAYLTQSLLLSISHEEAKLTG